MHWRRMAGPVLASPAREITMSVSPLLSVSPLFMGCIFGFFFAVTCVRLSQAQKAKNKEKIHHHSSSGLYFGGTAVMYLVYALEYPGILVFPSLQGRGSSKVLFDVISAPCIVLYWIYKHFRNKQRLKKERNIRNAIEMYGTKNTKHLLYVSCTLNLLD